MIARTSVNSPRPILWLVHYWWPLALGWSATVVVERATGRAADPAGLSLLLFGILAAYSLDRVSDPGDATSHPWVLWTLTITGAGCTAVVALLLLRLPIETAALVPALGAAAVMYPWAKRLPLFKSIVVPVVWTWAVVALPFNDGSWLGWRWMALPVSLPLTLLIAAGCLLCDLKDEERDRRDGVLSLPAMKDRDFTARVAVLLAVGACLAAGIEHRPALAVGAAALGSLALWPSLLARDAVGPLLVDVVLTIPGLLIATHVI